MPIKRKKSEEDSLKCNWRWCASSEAKRPKRSCSEGEKIIEVASPILIDGTIYAETKKNVKQANANNNDVHHQTTTTRQKRLLPARELRNITDVNWRWCTQATLDLKAATAKRNTHDLSKQTQATPSVNSLQETKMKRLMRKLTNNCPKDSPVRSKQIRVPKPLQSWISFEELQINNKWKIGGFGAVCKGNWKHKEIAVKQIIDRGPDKREKLIQMFEKEISLLRMLNHPHVVKFLGACKDPPCIVTEFVECGSLYDRLLQVPLKRNWPVIIKIAYEIALGMEYVHSVKICHKDLNPNNILVDSEWGVYITDFGIASLLSACGGEVTTTGQIGTARYAAPELLVGKRVRVLPFKADVYSFGLVLYMLCNDGVEPYLGESDKEVFASITQDTQRRPPPLKKLVPMQLVELVTQCWDGDANSRPSFGEIVQQLSVLRTKRPFNK